MDPVQVVVHGPGPGGGPWTGGQCYAYTPHGVPSFLGFENLFAIFPSM